MPEDLVKYLVKGTTGKKFIYGFVFPAHRKILNAASFLVVDFLF